MSIIYTDRCCKESIDNINTFLKKQLVTRLDIDSWSISDAMSIITLPSLELAVINIIDEVSVIEIGLLHFMCKPILVTSDTIKNYPIIKNKVIDFIDYASDLRKIDNTFIDWYIKKYMEVK